MENNEEIVEIRGEKWRMTMIDAPDYTGKPDKIRPKLNFEYKSDRPLYESWSVENEKIIQNTIKAFDAWILENLKSLYSKESPDDLTEDERFALVHHAGAKTTWFMVDGKFKGQTEPCGIIKPDGKWVVMFGNGEGRVLN